jgi:serine/threonine-protein phosphatase 2A regulatory subunit B'
MRTPRDIGIGEHILPKQEYLTNPHRTIHGMVYNAMKLFMEINPQLFDDCSHDYTEHQNTAEAREQAREDKWKALAEQAKLHKSNGTARGARAKATTPMRIDEVDPTTDENQKRLDSLKLQDVAAREQRRPSAHDRNPSVGSSRSAR